VSAKPIADWERIESDYRAGIKTLREIAAEHGITHGAINKRAKVQDWTRDLSAKIKAKAEELVSKSVVSKEVSKQRLATDVQTVAANAEAVANVAIRHREDLKALRDAAMAMLDGLIANGEHAAMLADIAEMLAKGTDSDAERGRLRQALMKAAELPSQIGSMKALAETITKLVDAERVAWKLDKGAAEPPRDMSDLEVASKLAHFVDVGRRRAPPPAPVQSPAPQTVQ
jgi:hypothetical protein